MNKISQIERFVICPSCGKDLKLNGSQLICKGCAKDFKLVDNDMPSMFLSVNKNNNFSMEKWDYFYKTDYFLNKLEQDYKQFFLRDTKRQVLEYAEQKSQEQGVYLEIGCGAGFLGEDLAKNGWFFIGVDFSINALKSLKKRLETRGINNYLLIHGDIQALPIRRGMIDLAFGGGVIEHLKNPQVAIEQIFQALAPNGISFNTVPFFNIGNLIYRSQWGGIPNVLGLKQLSELINIKILKGKHMIFGYELQFTQGQLRKFHLKAGFKAENIIFDRFKCHIFLHSIKSQYLKKISLYLCENVRQFWPMVKVIGIKKQ